MKAITHAAHHRREITRNTIAGRRRVSAKENHRDEGIIAAYKKVYQEVLVHPVDLSQYAPNAIPLHRIVDTAARRKADLQRDIVIQCRSGHDAIDDAHAPPGLGVYVRPPSVKKGPDEPTAFEAVGARKREAARGIVPVGRRRGHGL